MHLQPNIRTFFDRSDISQSLAMLGRCVGGLDRVVVLGGVLRELIFSQWFSAKPHIPDIDVAVLVDVDAAELIQSLGNRVCTLNSFGGVKWQTGNSLPLDIWTARVWAERIGKPSKSEYQIEEIKGFLDFNLNAGTYAPDTGRIDIEEITQGIKSGMFELHNSLVPPDSVQLARILKLEYRTKDFGLELGPQLREYVLGAIGSLSASGFREAQIYFNRKSVSLLGSAVDAYFRNRVSQLAIELAKGSRHARARS